MWRLGFASVFAIALACLSGTRAGAANPLWGDDATPVALLPLVDYSEFGASDSLILSVLETELADRGIAFRSPDELRPVLRAHRIRSQGSLSQNEAEILARESGVGRALFTVVCGYAVDRAPEFALSLRVVDLRTMDVEGAAVASAVGDDFAGWFGVGRKEESAALVAPIVRKALAELERSPSHHLDLPRLLVVPFDDVGEHPRAGEVVTEAAFAELFAAGWPVVEPGLARDLFLRRHVVPRGGVDAPTLQALRDSLGVELVLTGEVQTFRSAQSSAE
ncbi:MAG: hypothetical protein KC729_16235, partial [Candidatus Eisenbacteria bacterium]|nr:hypothetical protein [Candidatus Eisenbacteria bacterium]